MQESKMAKKKKTNSKKKTPKKAAEKKVEQSSPQQDERQQELPNVDPTKPLRDLALAAISRIAKEETVGMITIEFDKNGQTRFGWQGRTPRQHVVDAAEIVKQLFMLDEVIAMRNNLAKQLEAAKAAQEDGSEASG